MNRFLAFAVIFLTSSVQAEIDPRIVKLCMNAKDFSGCAKTMSDKQPLDNQNDCRELRLGLATVKERLKKGASWSELGENTNPLSDAIANAQFRSGSPLACAQLEADSRAILEMVRILRNQLNIEKELGTLSERQGSRVYPSPPIIKNIDYFNKLAGGEGVAITGPGVISGFSDTRRQGFDYELREWRGSWGMPCTDRIDSENWCGNYVVVSPRNRMFEVIITKIEASLNGTRPNWGQR